MFKALLVSAAFACTRAQMTPQGDCEPGYVQCSGWVANSLIDCCPTWSVWVSNCEPVAEGTCVAAGSNAGRKMLESRTLKQISPACSGSTCYQCSGGTAAAILNGSSCTCSDGSQCNVVSGGGSGPAGPIVGPIVGPIATPGGDGGVGSGDCPQRGPGESGSRCGGKDLIGYCEDQCGTGDNACCVVVNGVATPECNC